MILESLAKYNDILISKGEIPPEGWEMVNVSYSINIDNDGNFLGVSCLKESDDKGKTIPRKLMLPKGVIRSNSIKSNYLYDNSKYILGCYKSNDILFYCKEKLEAFKTLHQELLENVPSAKPFLIFLNNLSEHFFDKYVSNKDYDELFTKANITFRINGKFISEIESIHSKICEISHDNLKEGICLVTGKKAKIEVTHPKIKGIKDGQPAGTNIVSFNNDSETSYGKSQGFNAPISIEVANAYSSALNYLISSNKHKQYIGNTIYVYWTESTEDSYTDLFNSFFTKNETISDDDLSTMMKNICEGKPIDLNGISLNPKNKFYMIGMVTNSARISIRFFYQSTFGQLIKNISKHYEDIDIEGSGSKYPYVWLLLKETVRDATKDNINPCLSVSLLTSMLQNKSYTEALFSAIINRIRADKSINRTRMGLIKGYLIRSNYRYKEVLIMSLNEKSNCVPYLLGRTFCVLENIQKKANPEINSTITDKYFNSAAATPSVVFPQLIKLCNNHLRKIKEQGTTIYFSKMLTELLSQIESFPDRLSLQDQGAFMLGYYHQKQKQFDKRTSIGG